MPPARGMELRALWVRLAGSCEEKGPELSSEHGPGATEGPFWTVLDLKSWDFHPFSMDFPWISPDFPASLEAFRPLRAAAAAGGARSTAWRP